MANGSVEGSDWNAEELDLIVADYFSMLNDETLGLQYNKAEHRRTLLGKVSPEVTDHSNSSIRISLP